MPDLTQTPSFLVAIIALLVSIGGFLALKQGYIKQAGEIQDRVIAALKERIEIQDQKIGDLEKDRDRQNSVLLTIRYALKQRGLKIVIEGDFVTLSENGGKSSKIVRIQDRTALLDEDETG